MEIFWRQMTWLGVIGDFCRRFEMEIGDEGYCGPSMEDSILIMAAFAREI